MQHIIDKLIIEKSQITIFFHYVSMKLTAFPDEILKNRSL